MHSLALSDAKCTSLHMLDLLRQRGWARRGPGLCPVRRPAVPLVMPELPQVKLQFCHAGHRAFKPAACTLPCSAPSHPLPWRRMCPYTGTRLHTLSASTPHRSCTVISAGGPPPPPLPQPAAPAPSPSPPLPHHPYPAHAHLYRSRRNWFRLKPSPLSEKGSRYSAYTQRHSVISASTPEAVTNGSPMPRAASGMADAKSMSPTRELGGGVHKKGCIRCKISDCSSGQKESKQAPRWVCALLGLDRVPGMRLGCN